MAQLTVYRNKNARTRAVFPYLVDVQSNLLEELQTCIVIPLSKAPPLTKRPVSHLMPILRFEGEGYVLMTPQLAGMARSDLGSATGSLADRRDVIFAALDFLLTGFSSFAGSGGALPDLRQISSSREDGAFSARGSD